MEYRANVRKTSFFFFFFLICSSAQRPLEFFKNRTDRNRLIGFVVRGHAYVLYRLCSRFFFFKSNFVSFFFKWALGTMCAKVRQAESLI